MIEVKYCDNCDVVFEDLEMEHCTKCGAELHTAHDYSVSIGGNGICPDCSEVVDSDWDFCGFCGYELFEVDYSIWERVKQAL